EISPEDLVDKLLATGYKREDPVAAVGEFSLRGGIVDVWPPGREAPVRIEFFGDTIDSLREFDPETQLSTGPLQEAELPPMRELRVNSDDFREWGLRARERWSDPRYARALRDRTAFADEGESFVGWEWLISLMRDTNSTVFDYLKDVVFAIDEPSAIESYLGEVYQSLQNRFAEIEAADEIAPAPDELYLTTSELQSTLDQQQRIE